MLPQTRTIILCAVAVMSIDVGLSLCLAPRLRLVESIICTDYYRLKDPGLIGSDGRVEEKHCKVGRVQEEVAILMGWLGLWEGLPGVLLAVPYGLMADVSGRRKVLMWSFVGLFGSTVWGLCVFYLAFPIRLIWLSSLFMCIGGGPIVASALVFTIISDITSDEQRATIFFQIQASVLISDIVAPPLSSVLMSRNIWAPLLLGAFIQALSILVPACMPETLHITARETGHPSRQEPAFQLADDDEMDGRFEETDSKTKAGDYGSRIEALKGATSFLFQDRKISVLVLSLVVVRVGKQAVELLLQYVSKRYDWSLAKAAFLLSIRASVELVLLVAVLPIFGSFLLTRHGMAADVKDLLTIRVSNFFAIVGCVVIALAPAPGLMIVG
ncbi:MAG: hypothetical protein M1819_007254 [Sarea resinae]|nr:MAG: hypothetical protein M1819_007254 [Sarea resinae]